MAAKKHANLVIADQDALNNVPGGVAIFSYSAGKIKIVFANTGFYNVHHGSVDFWLEKNQNPIEWLSEEDKKIFWNEFKNVNEGKQKFGNIAYRIKGEDGAYHWVNNMFQFTYRNGNTDY